MNWAGHVARKEEWRPLYSVFVGKSKGKRSFGRPRRRWEDNIKINLYEVGCGGMDWLIWLRTGGGLFKRGNEPSGSTKGGGSFD